MIYQIVEHQASVRTGSLISPIAQPCEPPQPLLLTQGIVPRGAHHYRVIHSLAYTVKSDAGLVSLSDQFRKKRNISEYDHIGMISDQEAKEMIDLANQLRKDVEDWLRKNHPDLLAGK